MKTQRDESKRPPGKSSRLKNVLVILLIVAAVLLIVLFFAFRPQARQTATASTSPVSVSRMPPTDIFIVPIIPVTVTATLTFALPTAAPVVANGKEPPPCTFPLAQIKTAASAPANYMFSDPQVVLTAPKGDYYDIAQWLPDNHQVLMTEDLYNLSKSQGDQILRQSIALYDSTTGQAKIYASRYIVDEPPVWLARLNAVVYPDLNFLGLDQNTHQPRFTRQVWVSYGNSNITAQG